MSSINKIYKVRRELLTYRKKSRLLINRFILDKCWDNDFTFNFLWFLLLLYLDRCTLLLALISFGKLLVAIGLKYLVWSLHKLKLLRFHLKMSRLLIHEIEKYSIYQMLFMLLSCLLFLFL